MNASYDPELINKHKQPFHRVQPTKHAPGFTSPFPDPTPEQWSQAEASETETEGSERRARVEDECAGRTGQGPSLKRAAPRKETRAASQLRKAMLLPTRFSNAFSTHVPMWTPQRALVSTRPPLRAERELWAGGGSAGDRRAPALPLASAQSNAFSSPDAPEGAPGVAGGTTPPAPSASALGSFSSFLLSAARMRRTSLCCPEAAPADEASERLTEAAAETGCKLPCDWARPDASPVSSVACCCNAAVGPDAEAEVEGVDAAASANDVGGLRGGDEALPTTEEEAGAKSAAASARAWRAWRAFAVSPGERRTPLPLRLADWRRADDAAARTERADDDREVDDGVEGGSALGSKRTGALRRRRGRFVAGLDM